MEVQENLQLVTIQDHPIHGSFDVEVPETFSDDQVRNHVDGLDLDLLLGFKDQQTLGETDVKNIQEWENSTGAGKRNGLWFSHASLEGGTDTIAYGHKLTSEESETGVIKVGENSYNWREGLTQEAADSILNQDAGAAKGVALASLTKAGLEDNQGAIQALTSLIYNVGSGAWGKSKAKKFLEAGQVEDFLHEAFDPEIGFVKINGEVSRGLARRRSEEAELFASNIDKGSKFGKIVSEFVTALNPISSASAAEFTPPTSYTVQSGDTLSKIAKGNGISLDGLIQLNPQIKDINKIGIGDQINLTPPSAEPQESPILSKDQTKLRQIKDGANVQDTSDFFSLSLFSEAQAADVVEPEPLKQNEVPSSEDVFNTAKATNIVRHAWKTLGVDERNPGDQEAIKGFIDNAIGKKDALGSDPAVVATEKAWCTAWLYHVLTSAGLERTKLANQMNSSDPYDFVRAVKYKEVGEPVWKKGENFSSIKSGDIMVKMHTKEDIENPVNELKGRRVGFSGHVGIVTKVEGDNVYFISGNSGGKQVKESSYNLIDKDITIRRATGIKNVPTEIVKEVVMEEEWGSLAAGLTRLFNAKSFEDEAIQMFNETGLPSLAKKAKKKVGRVLDKVSDVFD